MGPAEVRERSAKALLEAVGTADQADLDAVLEHLKKVPEPLLQEMVRAEVRVLVARTSILEAYPELGQDPVPGAPPNFRWNNVRASHNLKAREIVVATSTPRSRIVVLPAPGMLLLREVGFMLDALLGDAAGGRSAKDTAWKTARTADPALPDWLRPAARADELYAEVFARYFGGDRKMQAEWPTLFVAFEAMYDALIAEEDARTHPDRMKRITKFMRTHVLANAAFGEPAQRFIGDLARRERGPWDRPEGEKHILALRAAGDRFFVDTRWGPIAYVFAEDPHDRAAEQQRAADFFEKLVEKAPRITAPTKAKIKERMALEYGPWRAESLELIKSVFESRGRVMIKTTTGDIIL